jgi:putative transposase
VLKTPVQAPQVNPICERFIGSVRRECLDHILMLSERQFHRVIGEYVAYFNYARPHQGIGQRIPDPPEVTLRADTVSLSQIAGYPVLGGLHHDYQRAA